MKKAVIFDVDGVLIHSENHYQTRRENFFKTKGIILNEADHQLFIGSNPKAMMRYLFPGDEKRQKQILKEYAAFSIEHPLDTTAFINPDAKEVLEELRKQGLRLAIASSGPLLSIQAMLQANNLTKYFEQVLSGESFKESKPNPEIYLESVAQLQLANEACLVVEDSAYGIQAAVAADLDVLALKQTDYYVDQSLAKARINSLWDVLDFI